MSTMRKSNQTILDSQTVRFNISGGPSRDRIFDACKYLHDKVKIDLDFKVILGYSAPKDDPCCAAFEVPIKDFRVHKIMHEDGSGESFMLSGRCKADLDPCMPIIKKYKEYGFSAWYNSKRRTGWISLTEKEGM